MDRRDFLKSSALWAAALATFKPSLLARPLTRPALAAPAAQAASHYWELIPMIEDIEIPGPDGFAAAMATINHGLELQRHIFFDRAIYSEGIPGDVCTLEQIFGADKCWITGKLKDFPENWVRATTLFRGHDANSPPGAPIKIETIQAWRRYLAIR